MSETLRWNSDNLENLPNEMCEIHWQNLLYKTMRGVCNLVIINLRSKNERLCGVFRFGFGGCFWISVPALGISTSLRAQPG